MGMWFWGAFGEKDQLIIEKISKEHKFDLEIVAKNYKDFIEKCQKDLQD